MKESYRKGLASHPGPESCGDAREGVAEALTGERASGVSSLEITQILVPTPWPGAIGNIGRSATASSGRTRRGRSTLACTEAPHTGTGRSRVRPTEDGPWDRVVKAVAGRPR